MGFIQEAEIMLDAAEKAAGSQALRVGWLTLAKDTISAALTEAKKGVKAQDGHVVVTSGQTQLEDFTAATNHQLAEPSPGTVYGPEFEEHRRHWEDHPGLFAEDCTYCGEIAAGTRSGTVPVDHDRPDTSGGIPRIGDSRPIPEDDEVPTL